MTANTPTTFADLVHARRSIYEIGTNTDVTVDDVAATLRNITGRLPSAVNSQSTRLVIVTGEKNDAVWDMVHEDQKTALSPDMYEIFAPRFEQAKKGLGTVLMFESRDAVESMGLSPDRNELYKENNHGIAAFGVWLALTELGLGASLQHFNIGYEQGYDAKIREYLELPTDFEMLAQMPFGSIEEPGAQKPSIAPEEHVFIA